MASDGEISCTNDPNFAVIYSFLKVFGKLYGLEIFTIDKLQEFIEDTQEVSEPLKELHLRLLRRAIKSVQSNRWERSLIKFCHQQGSHQEAWEIERFSYKKASTQVKLKILKILLEYQFTCNPKFKNAVNGISCKDLRLDPVGKDKNGCVYWLQVDHDANLCLYKEDQDEETWQLIARSRDELVKVIAQLKSGEEVCPLKISNTNEDSNSTEIPPTVEVNTEPQKPETEEDNEEEFLSPESETDCESDDQKDDKEADTKELEESKKEVVEEPLESLTKVDEKDNLETQEEEKDLNATEKDVESNESVADTIEKKTESLKEEKTNEPKPETSEDGSDQKENVTEEVGEAIEEPVMVVTGEGNGEDCESFYIIGEEISEPVMYFYGEGCGFDNDTGNPEAIEQANNENKCDEENPVEECFNGENSNDLSNSNIRSKLSKGVKLKNTTVNKRTLKKQSNDTSELLKTDSKKHCVRESDKTSNNAKTDNVLKRDSIVNDKITTETINKNCIKKGRGKVKKKGKLARSVKLNEGKDVINSVSETDNGIDSKASIIEKRKSSVSSEDQHDSDNSVDENEKTPENEIKPEDDLPPKKLRLEATPESDVGVSHSKETVDTIQNVNKNEVKKIIKIKDNLNRIESISPKKKIKANKGKFKRKKTGQKRVENGGNADENRSSDKVKKESKSLKRSRLDSTMTDKNKSESQSESEDDEPVTSGKRLKIKPKKIITASRKKVEAKLQEKNFTDESEEETLYSIAGKKSPKKVLKKKPKGKEKAKPGKDQSDDSDLAPVRQSRRIAQMKIKEEADRRHLEEVTLRELKMIHKKKKEDEEEWQASDASSSEPERRSRRPAPNTWRAADSTGPDADSDSEPLFEHEHEPEPDLEFGKSDHEFSPESDLESGEPVAPLKRVRTLQEGKDEVDGFCKRCGSGEQPEWILLCDACDAGYHASCLKPLLLLVPEGDWFCPPCDHERLVAALERELVQYDELVAGVQAERARRHREDLERPADPQPDDKQDQSVESADEGSASSDWSSSSSEGAVYRLRARKQLPVSYRSQEYDRLISSAIKEEYVEPTTSAGNQGRGKDISTIIEAAEEEKMKAEREAIQQGIPVEVKKLKKKQRRKPRKLNSLEVPSEDDNETDEDFKDTGMESSSEEISSSAERHSTGDSGSSDSLPIRRTCRPEKKDRPRLRESSPEGKKKGAFHSSSESEGTKEWHKELKSKSKKMKHSKKREKPWKKSRKRNKLTQYDAEGNVIRARVTYGGLSGDDDPNDWSPKHRTRQKKINYTEMPNTESEDEMHKSSGKHMADSSDEFKLDDSDVSSESESGRAAPAPVAPDDQTSEEKRKAICELIKKTAVVPLEKLPEDVTKAKTEELQAHLDAQAALNAAKAARSRGQRGGRGTRGMRGRGRGGSSGVAGATVRAPPETASDDALAKLVGVKIKELRPDGVTLGRPCQADREKKRLEREAKQAEKEARRVERLQKKEEKEKLKEQKAKEREEKKQARLAMQETKRIKKEKPEFSMGGNMGGYGIPVRPLAPEMQRMNMYGNSPMQRHPGDFQEQRFPTTPRLQVRAELRGVLSAEERMSHSKLRPEHPNVMREGTLSVAGSPQPFKPISEEPSIITRMPHMINQQYRGPMMYSPGNSPYGPRNPQNMMYPIHHPGMNHPPNQPQYPPQYYSHIRGLPPGYPAQGLRQGPPGAGPPSGPHRPPGPHRAVGPPVPGAHGPSGPMPAHPGGPPPHGMQLGPGRPPPGVHGPPVSSPHALGPPMSTHGPQTSSPHALGPPMSTHGPPGMVPGAPGPVSMLHLSMGARGPPGPHPGAPPTGPRLPGGPGLLGPRGPQPPGPASPVGPPPASSPVRGAPPAAPVVDEEPIRIKAEVKTEPEYRSPAASPTGRSPPPQEPPRNHPKIKHTENKDRRARYPLGPYAPQYGPYGPYAPTPGAPPEVPPTLLGLQPRPPYVSAAPRAVSPAHLFPSPRADRRPPSPAAVRPDATPQFPRPEAAGPASVAPDEPPSPRPVKLEAGETEPGGVFGGLVSYFSSQREDDMDA